MAKKKSNSRSNGIKRANKTKSSQKLSAKTKGPQGSVKSKSKGTKKAVPMIVKKSQSVSKSSSSSKEKSKPNLDWRATSGGSDSFSSTRTATAPTKMRSALGRGLSALLGGPMSTPAPVREIPVVNNVEKSNSWEARPQRETGSVIGYQEGNLEVVENNYEESISSSLVSEEEVFVPKSVMESSEIKSTEDFIWESKDQNQNTDKWPSIGDVFNTKNSETGFEYLSLSSLAPNPNQPRKNFDETEIATLSDSIKESGLLQPILVRKTGAQVGAPYQVVAGERRYRAAIKAGLTQVPVIVKDLTDKETLQIGIIENVQRADLNPIEEALAYRKLIDEFGENQADVAKAVGKDRTSIANALRLLKLPEVVLNMIGSAQISSGHGRALLMLEQEKKQISLAKKIWKEGLSVRAVEKLCSKSLTVKGEKGQEFPAKSPILMDIEDRLRRALGTKITLNVDDSGKGELRVNFYSQGELENLLDRLGA
jgi:ParB family transcriptional regulator, chromosome partitioning protein